MILDNIRPELNPVEFDDGEQADDQPGNSEIKMFDNYSKALEQLICLKMLYLNKDYVNKVMLKVNKSFHM
jgi:hypothetical protein